MIARKKEPDMIKANIGNSVTILPSLPESSQATESARLLAQYLTGETRKACHIQFDSGASRKPKEMQ
jgi:phage gpG-like protein